MRQNKFLLYPLILFAFIFLLDKIFLLDSVKGYIKSDFTYIYYETKEELFKLLLQRNAKKESRTKLMIVLGSSRLLYFDAKDLTDFYPDWEIWNFSSAVTTPAYYYYYLDKITEAGIQPDLILLETDPNQFNANAPVFKGSNLTYSFDLPFVLRHANLFGKEYVSFYLGKTLFAASKNKPYIDTAWKRLTDSRFQALDSMRSITKNFLLENKGNAMSPIENYVEKDFGILEATSKRTIDWLYGSYIDSEMQFTFYKMILSKLQEKKISTLIVWPQSSKPMQDMLQNVTAVKTWKQKIDSITNNYGFQILEMGTSTDYHCNSFADGGHIAKDCYRPFIRYIFIEYYRRYGNGK